MYIEMAVLKCSVTYWCELLTAEQFPLGFQIIYDQKICVNM